MSTLSPKSSPMGMDQDNIKSQALLSSTHSCINDIIRPLSIPVNDVNFMTTEINNKITNSHGHNKFHNESQQEGSNCDYCKMYRSSPKRKRHESDQNTPNNDSVFPSHIWELDHGSKRLSEDKTSFESAEYKSIVNLLDTSSSACSDKAIKEFIPFSLPSHHDFSKAQSRVVTALFQDTVPGVIAKTPSNLISPKPQPSTSVVAGGAAAWSVPNLALKNGVASAHPTKRPPPPLPPSLSCSGSAVTSDNILGSPPAVSRRRARAPESISLGSTFPTIRATNGASVVPPSSHRLSLLSDSHDSDREQRNKPVAGTAFESDQSGVAEPMSSLSVGKRRARTSPPRVRRSTIATASAGSGLGFGSPRPTRFFASLPLVDAGSAFSDAALTRPPPPRALSASAAQSSASRVARNPSFPSPPTKPQDRSEDMDELTLKDLGTPVTEVGSPAVMEDMIYGHYTDADVDSPLFIYQPDLFAVGMSPGGERDSSGLHASDSDVNSSMDSMEDNARSAACRRKDRGWLPYSRNGNGYGISIGSYNSKPAFDSANASSSSGFGHVFTPAAVAASSGAAAGRRIQPPAPAAERSLRFERDDDGHTIRSLRTPLFAMTNDGFSSMPGSEENYGLAQHSSATVFKTETATSSNMNNSLAANTTVGSISLSLSCSQHQDSGCTDSTDENHLEEDTRSNLDNSDCSAGSSNGNGHCNDLAARPAPHQRHSVSSPHAGLALAGMAVVVSKRNSKTTALTTQPPARPLPDPAAFEPAGAMEDCDGDGSEAGSALAAHLFCPAGSPTGPICPPTPARTPHWGDHHHHQGRAHSKHGRHKDPGESSSWLADEDRDIDRDSDARHVARTLGTGIPPLVSLHRQSSLDESKLLLDGRNGGEGASAGVNFSKDFEHLGVLGKGVFGDVFLARSRMAADGDGEASSSSSSSGGKLFAVKKSRKQFRSKSDREWLLNEVRAMKKISDGFQDSCRGTSECVGDRESEGAHKDHPGVYIVQFIRAWQEDSYFYVQIEFVERGTVKDLINGLVKEQRTVPDSTLWVLLHDVAAGLMHIHNCGVVHLDIKPANLLISAHGVIKIGDFGMAASVGSKEDGKEGDNKYMANELLNNCERHPSADIFSLALTLYEASYSEKQLREGSISLPAQGQMWHVLRSGKAPSLRHRAPVLAALVATAMSPDPTLRPSAADILRVQEVAAVPSGLDREAQRAVADGTLLSAELIQPNPRLFQHQGRSRSFLPIHGMGLGLTVNIPEGGGGMDDDSDRAFTPHF